MKTRITACLLPLLLTAPCIAQAPAPPIITVPSENDPGAPAPPPIAEPAGPNGAPALPQTGTPTVPQVRSQFTVLMDADSGQIIWARNPDVRRSIASTTKILTAILLLERGHPYDIVTAPAEVKGIPESSLHLAPGETIPLHDLLYAMLLRSANDTAVAGADYLAGSVPAFADLMNQKAAEIGTRNSHFVTPNGLYDPNHYSTAADMALIARYAVTHLPEFNEIVKTQRYTVARSIRKSDSVVLNTSSTYLKRFPGADGIKTGYIRQAGHCFVGSATRNDWRLIAVVLNSGRCREDVESLLNYGYANFVRVPAVYQGDVVGQASVENGAGSVNVVAAQNLSVVTSRFRAMPAVQKVFVPSPVLPPAPVAAGAKVGIVQVLLNGKVVASEDAVTASQVALRPSVVWIRRGRAAGITLTRLLGGLCATAGLFALAKGIYARTFTKSNGGGRDRLAAEVRGVDHEQTGIR